MSLDSLAMMLGPESLRDEIWAEDEDLMGSYEKEAKLT